MGGARRPLRRDAHDHPRQHRGERRPPGDPGRPRLLPVEPRLGVNAYLIAFGGLLLLAGRLGDLVGRRRVFLAGLRVFTLASLLCGAAQSQVMLVAARFIQGVGGAMTSAVILGMIVTMFPEPREQAKAIGVYSFVASAGGSIGLLAGGVLTAGDQLALDLLRQRPDRDRDRGRWRCAVCRDRGPRPRAAAPTRSARCYHRRADARRLHDRQGRRDYGWGSPHTLGLGAVALALLAGFVVRQARAAQPAGAAADLPLAQRVRRQRGPGADGGRAVRDVLPRARCTSSACSGYDALETGLAFLPVTLAIGTLSLGFSSALNMRFGRGRRCSRAGA